MSSLSVNSRIFLLTLREHEQRNERLRTTSVAMLLGVSKAAITEITKALSSDGFINYKPYHPYSLTPQGKLLAQKLQNRTATIEKYFFTQFKLNPYTARHEAIRAESGLSEQIINAMREHIPFPNIGLFGQNLSNQHGYELKPLLKCNEGLIVIPAAITHQPDTYGQPFWEEIANFMGKPLYINAIDYEIEAIQVLINNTPRHIGFKVADKILVSTQTLDEV